MTEFSINGDLTASGFGNPQAIVGNGAIATTNGCGLAGLSSDKTGPLAAAAIKFCSDARKKGRKQIIVLEIGPGDGSLAVKLVAAGAAVTAVDVVNQLAPVARELCAAGKLKLVVIEPDQDVAKIPIPSSISLTVSRRALHWAPYDHAKIWIGRSVARQAIGDVAIFSVASFNCPLAHNAAPDTVPIMERHAAAPTGKGKFTSPVTLYTEREFRELIEGVTVRGAAYKIKNVRLSKWGLWKADCVVVQAAKARFN